MRAFLAVAAAMLFAFSLTTITTDTAEAGLKRYMICWMTPSGVSDCAWLPRHYRLSWVRKPYCSRSHCRNGTVSFTLTRSRIRCLGAFVDTSAMFPTHTATIYAPKYGY